MQTDATSAEDNGAQQSTTAGDSPWHLAKKASSLTPQISDPIGIIQLIDCEFGCLICFTVYAFSCPFVAREDAPFFPVRTW